MRAGGAFPSGHCGAWRCARHLPADVSAAQGRAAGRCASWAFACAAAPHSAWHAAQDVCTCVSLCRRSTRLSCGCEGVPCTSAVLFASGPTGTLHSLRDIMYLLGVCRSRQSAVRVLAQVGTLTGQARRPVGVPLAGCGRGRERHGARCGARRTPDAPGEVLGAAQERPALHRDAVHPRAGGGRRGRARARLQPHPHDHPRAAGGRGGAGAPPAVHAARCASMMLCACDRLACRHVWATV